MRHCDFNSKVRRSDVHATSSKPETCIQKRRDINLVPLPCITKVFKNKNKFRDMLSRSGWRWSKPFSVENALSYSVIMKEGVVRNAYLQITEGRNGVRRMTIIRLGKKKSGVNLLNIVPQKTTGDTFLMNMKGCTCPGLPILVHIIEIERMVFFQRLLLKHKVAYEWIFFYWNVQFRYKTALILVKDIYELVLNPSGTSNS